MRPNQAIDYSNPLRREVMATCRTVNPVMVVRVHPPQSPYAVAPAPVFFADFRSLFQRRWTRCRLSAAKRPRVPFQCDDESTRLSQVPSISLLAIYRDSFVGTSASVLHTLWPLGGRGGCLTRSVTFPAGCRNDSSASGVAHDHRRRLPIAQRMACARGPRRLELADVARASGDRLRATQLSSGEQLAALRAIEDWRTPPLGGVRESCADCR